MTVDLITLTPKCKCPNSAALCYCHRLTFHQQILILHQLKTVLRSQTKANIYSRGVDCLCIAVVATMVTDSRN